MLLAATSVAHADLIDTGTETYYGHVVQIANGELLFDQACQHGSRHSVDLKSVERVELNSKCTKYASAHPAAGLVACAKPLLDVWGLRFGGYADPIFATAFVLHTDRTFQAELALGSGMLTGTATHLRSAVRTKACPDDVKPLTTSPAGTCFEPRQWAANWAPQQVYNNAIFTKGFALRIEHVDAQGRPAPQDADAATDIREAMGTALTHWASTLQRHKELLDDSLRQYLASILSCSTGGMCLLTPPQVIQVACPASAMFVIQVHHEHDAAFTTAERSYVAKAQVEGRTIFVNAADFHFRSDNRMTVFLADHKVNLVTVLTHELGHAFGLSHREGDPNSVMSPANPAASPSADDARAFIAALKRSVEGAKPGSLDPTSCAGLRVE